MGKKLLPTSEEVAVALAALTREYGAEMAQNLYAWHKELNTMFFDGRLETPIIWPGGSAGKRDGAYTPQTEHGLKSTIFIYRKALRTTQDYVKEVLLHEMIHQWCHEVEEDAERSYRGHGPVFCSKANEIGEQLGYAEVGPKGRNGKAIPGAWPHWPDTSDAPADNSSDSDDDSDDEDERDEPELDLDDVGVNEIEEPRVELESSDTKYVKRFAKLDRAVQLAIIRALSAYVL